MEKTTTNKISFSTTAYNRRTTLQSFNPERWVTFWGDIREVHPKHARGYLNKFHSNKQNITEVLGQQSIVTDTAWLLGHTSM